MKPGRDLLGLAEINMGGIRERAAIERHDALVTLGVRALIDGHGEIARAEQFARGQARRVEMGIGANEARCRELGDQKVDRPVGAGLKDEAALEFQPRSE